MKRAACIRSGFLSLTFACASHLVAQTASISGMITTPAGLGLPGVTVYARTIPKGLEQKRRPAVSNTTVGSALTGTNGQFTISNVPIGTYFLCPSLPGSTYLNPCLWSDTIPIANVTAAGPVTGITAAMQAGKTVRLDLLFPPALYSLAANKLEIDKSLVLVWSPNITGPIFPSVIADHSGGRLFSVAVPPNSSLQLVVHSSRLSLTDTNDLPLRAGPVVYLISVPQDVDPSPVVVKAIGLLPLPLPVVLP